MPMNIVIQEQRKLLGLTQEQVADYLGVSTPAVSKWEKGITSPDIGLLPPLARLLKIDLNTLFCFNEDLSAQEIGLFCNELAKQAIEDILSAFEVAEAKTHDYPHNEQLLLNVTIILDSMLLQAQETTLSIDNLDSKISDWYLQLSQSNDDKIRNSANYMRVNRYIRQGKVDAAQEVLDTIQDKNELFSSLPDKLMLQVSVYLQQHKADLAALELEKALFREIIRVQLLLTKLVDAELAAGNIDFARRIAEKTNTMVDVFDMWEYNRYVASYQIAEQEKNADTMLPLLEQMLEALTTHWSLTDSVLYHRMAPETKEMQSQELMSILLRAMETDPNCAYLREHSKYSELISKYKSK
uniref:helix-turn-helix domain-containing protein n=1 Tax=Agathobacter sp. TaxID=2021311 RepID=UPI004056661A